MWADVQVAQGEDAESARITQASKGVWGGGGVSRFHLIGNEEPLKDFKSSQEPPGWCVRKQTPGWLLPPGPSAWQRLGRPQLPRGWLFSLPTFHLNHQVMWCWPVTPHALNSNKCNPQPICHRPLQRYRKERRAGKVKCCQCRCNVLMLIAGKAVNLPFPTESNSNGTRPRESGWKHPCLF